MDPGPNPFPIPREQWPVDTRVAASDEPVSLRWDEGCVLEAEAGTVFMLRSANEQVVPAKPRSIQFESGTLTVRIEPPPVPADILAGDSRIRASQPPVFTLKGSGRQPLAHEVTRYVMSGEILLLRGDGGKRTVTAGEDVEVL